jgi:hypothetical protein
LQQNFRNLREVYFHFHVWVGKTPQAALPDSQILLATKSNGVVSGIALNLTCTPHNSAHDPIPNTSLSAGPLMSPLTKAELELFLPYLPHLLNIWIHTAEAVILDRGVKERPQDIKRTTNVLLGLIRDDGTDLGDDWENILINQTIDAPPSMDEWRSRERPTAKEPPPALEQSEDATTSESTPNVESTTSADSGPRAEDMKPEDPHIKRIHTIELERSM